MNALVRRAQRYGILLALSLAAGCQQTTSGPGAATPTTAAPATLVAAATSTQQAPATIPPTSTNRPTETAIASPTAEQSATATGTATPWPIPEVSRDINVSLPPGFSFIKFADLFRPTAFAFDPQGRLYVASFDGTIHVLWDEDGDGRTDLDATYFSGLNTPLGLAFRPGSNDLYVSDQGRILILKDDNNDMVVDETLVLLDDLPFGRHQNNDLVFGPDGWLYVGVGSTCDACYEADPRSATIMRIDPDSGTGDTIATGLRNPFGLAFDPRTDALFATDNGRDDLGPDVPKEELNHIISGADYGFPDCWDEMQVSNCASSRTAIGFFTAHSSANNIIFYEGNAFPPGYQGDAYVTLFGSWLVQGLSTGIVRVSLTSDGNSFSSEMTWFASWDGGMPLGLIAGPDGAIYVGDYINDKVYRISYGAP